MTFNVAELITAIKGIIEGLFEKIGEVEAGGWVKTFFEGFDAIFGGKLDDKEIKVG